jgi:hypothetical protein
MRDGGKLNATCYKPQGSKEAVPATLSTLDNDHRLLLAEVFRLMMAQQLFTSRPANRPSGEPSRGGGPSRRR